VRVLDGQQSGRRIVDVGRVQGGSHLVGREGAAASDGLDLEARQGGRCASLGPEDVRVARRDHHVAGAGVDAQRGLVRHRAGREEQCGGLAEQGRHPLL
jgi:hypothetical protein